MVVAATFAVTPSQSIPPPDCGSCPHPPQRPRRPCPPSADPTPRRVPAGGPGDHRHLQAPQGPSGPGGLRPGSHRRPPVLPRRHRRGLRPPDPPDLCRHLGQQNQPLGATAATGPKGHRGPHGVFPAAELLPKLKGKFQRTRSQARGRVVSGGAGLEPTNHGQASLNPRPMSSQHVNPVGTNRDGSSACPTPTHRRQLFSVQKPQLFYLQTSAAPALAESGSWRPQGSAKSPWVAPSPAGQPRRPLKCARHSPAQPQQLRLAPGGSGTHRAAPGGPAGSTGRLWQQCPLPGGPAGSVTRRAAPGGSKLCYSPGGPSTCQAVLAASLGTPGGSVPHRSSSGGGSCGPGGSVTRCGGPIPHQSGSGWLCHLPSDSGGPSSSIPHQSSSGGAVTPWATLGCAVTRRAIPGCAVPR